MRLNLTHLDKKMALLFFLKRITVEKQEKTEYPNHGIILKSRITVVITSIYIGWHSLQDVSHIFVFYSMPMLYNPSEYSNIMW